MIDSFINFEIKCQKEIAEELSEFLFELGSLSVSIEDSNHNLQAETPLFVQTIDLEIPLWDMCTLKALYVDKEIFDLSFSFVKEYYGNRIIDINVSNLQNIDWVEECKKNFETIKITDKMWIIPSWIEEKNPGIINIHLDPGLAFGTGSHPTTFLCLKWLEDNLQAHDIILDYGCGSGILGIAAMKLGANKCDSIDIDDLAIKSTKENAEKNNVCLQTYLDPKELNGRKYDILVANILANPLKQLVDEFQRYLQPTKKIILSGILRSQVDSIVEIYENYFSICDIEYNQDWACIVGLKK